MEPKFIDGNVARLLELIRPLPAMLVLNIFPFRSNAFFEKVVIGLESQLGGRSNVILTPLVSLVEAAKTLGRSYVNTPEFLDRVEGDDFLQ